jgi:Myb/SANT-like DNA-binding protein
MGRKRKAATQPTVNGETEKEKTPDLQWTDAMETSLFNAFLEQYNKGKRADLGWKREAWGPIIEAVQTAYEGQQLVTKAQCQTKEATYKAHYKDHLYLKNLPGFSWNEELGVFEASPEAWDEQIKVRMPPF